MNVSFATVKLRDRYEHIAAAKAAWGERSARAYISTVTALQSAPTLEDLRLLRSFRLRELSPTSRFALGERSTRESVRFTHTPPQQVHVDGWEHNQ